MRRQTLSSLAAVFAIAAAFAPTASQADVVDIPTIDTLKIKPVGFWLHHDDASCDCCDVVDGCIADCDGCCPDSCDGCLFGDCQLLGGLVKPSDECFNDFISPMINFVHFEDPRSVSELRPIFVNHWVPGTIGAGVPAGGTIQLFALQFRARLTENLSLIAVKDGYIIDNTNGTLDTLLGDGWASVTAGLKYNFYRDECSGTLASAGFTYEIPVGSSRALQDVGDGEFHLFATAGKRFLDGDAHVLSAFGWRLPTDGAAQSQSIHWSNHFDYRVTKKAYLFTEFAWWHWVDDPSNPLLAAGVAGQDLFNLPFSGVEGKSLVTQSVGVKLKPNDKTEVGVAYEFPLTGFEDVISSRLMFDLILRY